MPVVVVGLLVVGCGGGDDDAAEGVASSVAPESALDYVGLGLWADGPCDAAAEPLRLGIMTTYESPLLSLRPFVTALEASATAFNARGGANGACIEVIGCDDGANPDQAIGCVREIDEAGVVATVNDQGAAAHADVSSAMADAGIPRIATNVTPADWDDQNAFPLDGAGTGVTFVLPQVLVEQGSTKLAVVRVDVPGASALIDLLEDAYAESGVTFPVDLPVAAGTTDYSQFVLAAEDAGADGVVLALGEQEAIQVISAAEQLNSDLIFSRGFPHARMADLGEFAEQLYVASPYPFPTSLEVPVYDVIRADLAASGDPDLQPENLDSSAMRSWIGLYALLRMIRDAGMTEFSRDAIRAMVEVAIDVPMLGIYGGEDWTPDVDRAGLFQRAGIDHWGVYGWDGTAAAPDGLEGNYVQTSTVSLDDILCGSPIGTPEPC